MTRKYTLEEGIGWLVIEGSGGNVPNQRQIQLILQKFHDDVCTGYYAAEIIYQRIYEARYAWLTMFTFNSRIRSSVGFSSFQLLYGYQPVSAVQNLV